MAPTQSIHFNLWSQPWIRVLDTDGKPTMVSIYECLTRAHELGVLADPSPLTVVGTHRLLAAILQFIYDPQTLDHLTTILQSGRFELAKLDDFGVTYSHRFDLFDPVYPFLQTQDIAESAAEKSSVSRLFAEIPTETNRTLFMHVTDDEHRVCAACCAAGLVTISPFASAGGASYRPSINGVPPVYILPLGETLFDALATSLINPNFAPRSVSPERSAVAPWTSDEVILRSEQVISVGYVESLLFPARRLMLFPNAVSTKCTRCGQPTGIIVAEVAFEAGRWFDSKTTEPWGDPFVAFQLPKKEGEVRKAMMPKEGKALWRDYGTLFLSQANGAGARPAVISQIEALVNRGVIPASQTIRIRCVWLRTDGKAKIFDWGDYALEVPALLLSIQQAETVINQALGHSELIDSSLKFWFYLFSAKTDEKGTKRDRYKTVHQRLHATYWQELAAPFATFIQTLGAAYEVGDEDAVNTTLVVWDETLFNTGERVFRESIDQIGEQANIIRARVEAETALNRDFHNKRKDWIPQ